MSDPCCKFGTPWCIIAHDTSDEACRPLDDSLFDRPGGRRHIDPSLLLEVARQCESDRVAEKAKVESYEKALIDIRECLGDGHIKTAWRLVTSAIAAIAAVGKVTT